MLRYSFGSGLGGQRSRFFPDGAVADRGHDSFEMQRLRQCGVRFD